MKRMYSMSLRFAAGAVALGLAACSGSGTNPDTPTQAAIATNVLQFNVGTANIFGDVPASAVAGTNFVVTYRQAAGQLSPGDSAALVSSPTITLPAPMAHPAGATGSFSATIATGPSAAEVGGTQLTSTGQTSTNATTFGTSTGAFGLGLEPFNYAQRGKPDSNVAYKVPLYDQVPKDPNAFSPIGGLPAFDPAGNAAASIPGVSEGLDIFALTPAVGTYTLSVAVPANTGTLTQTASAPISSVALLPAILPAVPTTVGADGSATFTVVLPAGVTEAYVQIADIGPTAADGVSCVGASAAVPVYYTIVVKASGAAALPAGSLCSATANNTAGGTTDSDGDEFAVNTIGFDYPAYEMSYPSSSGNPAPSVVGLGATKQADVTVSSKTKWALPVPGGAPVPGP